MQTKFGFPYVAWEKAEVEIREILVKLAKIPHTIYYSDLVENITTISLEPHSYALFQILGEISKDEDHGHRGMLSALVINRDTGIPGQGFFDLSEKLGKGISDKDKCWITELNKVHAYWQSKP